MILDSREDGVSHINIYSNGATRLGRNLSNFAYCPIKIGDNIFNSIEGYWYWLGTRDERLKTLCGKQAKLLGKSLPRICSEIDFEETITKALDKKIKTDLIFKDFLDSTLPFKHYYVFNSYAKDAGYPWITNHFTLRRNQLKEWVKNKHYFCNNRTTTV